MNFPSVTVGASQPSGPETVIAAEVLSGSPVTATGISAEVEGQKDVVLLIYARSSLATKNGIAPANCVGVVDWDYRGEIIVALHNSSDKDFTVCDGDRIAQLVITPVFTPETEYDADYHYENI